MAKLTLLSAKATAVTYSFQLVDEKSSSWALCTVNDQTGELFISSDWGSWSYRWNAAPSALGAESLTAFIATRPDVDYLARKLQQEHRNGQAFSARLTAQDFKKLLCIRRLMDGRDQIKNWIDPKSYANGKLPARLIKVEGYNEDGFPKFNPNKKFEVNRYLTKDKARELWDQITYFANEYAIGDLFFDRCQNADGFMDYVTDDPWRFLRTEPTVGDRALCELILPALIEACQERMYVK